MGWSDVTPSDEPEHHGAEDCIFFLGAETVPVLVLKTNGKVFFRGRHVATDKELVDGFRAWLRWATQTESGFVFRPATADDHVQGRRAAMVAIGGELVMHPGTSGEGPRQISREFAVHMLNADGKEKAGEIALAFDHLLAQLEVLCPAGRELAIVRTKLEEACFFAKKAMASDASNCEVAPP